jgi:C4-dicarboxylate transporter DctM subunit
MIPPSINLIVYGFLTESSIPQLFLAGLVPGLFLAGLFMADHRDPLHCETELGGPRRSSSWGENFAGLADLLPILGLFAAIVGSIYAGWATPTEAATVGVAIALVIAAHQKALSRAMLPMPCAVRSRHRP